MVGESGYELWTVWCPSPCLCQDVGLCSYCPLPNISPFIQEKKQENISKKETQNRQPFKKAPLSFKILKGKIRPSQKDITAKKKISLLKRKILFTSCWWDPVWFFGTKKSMSMTVTFLHKRTEKPFLWLRQVCIGHIISDSDNDSSFHAIPVSFMPGIDRWVHTTFKPWQ